MYYICKYCRHKKSLSELAKNFSASASGLTYCKNSIANDLAKSKKWRNYLKKIDKYISKKESKNP